MALSETRSISIQLSNYVRTSRSMVTWTYRMHAESSVKSDKLMSLVTLPPYKLSVYGASASFHDTNFLPVCQVSHPVVLVDPWRPLLCISTDCLGVHRKSAEHVLAFINCRLVQLTLQPQHKSTKQWLESNPPHLYLDLANKNSPGVSLL